MQHVFQLYWSKKIQGEQINLQTVGREPWKMLLRGKQAQWGFISQQNVSLFETADVSLF